VSATSVKMTSICASDVKGGSVPTAGAAAAECVIGPEGVRQEQQGQYQVAHVLECSTARDSSKTS
jgi:hypothetical protein